jgi:hypothetical protein
MNKDASDSYTTGAQKACDILVQKFKGTGFENRLRAAAMLAMVLIEMEADHLRQQQVEGGSARLD